MAASKTDAQRLTELDRAVIALCERISSATETLITDAERRQKYKNDFGKIVYNRHAGSGRGGGKLQRDALCTRGTQARGPHSNRNLRWHPLVTASQGIAGCPEIKRLEIIDAEKPAAAPTLRIIVEEGGAEKSYHPGDAHTLPVRHVVLPEHWEPHVEELKEWGYKTHWEPNTCMIPSHEACDWQDAAEAYAILNLSVAVNLFAVKFDELYRRTVEILRTQTVVERVTLPTAKFPSETDEDSILTCPMCKVRPPGGVAGFQPRERGKRWSPQWGSAKRGEGEDDKLQIMHVEPLAEAGFMHNGRNVRFGHRWCNVAMSDHSIDETLKFMNYVVNTAHPGSK